LSIPDFLIPAFKAAGLTEALGMTFQHGDGRRCPQCEWKDGPSCGGAPVTGKSKSPPVDPGRTPTTRGRTASGAGRTSTLAEYQRARVGARSLSLDGQRRSRSCALLRQRAVTHRLVVFCRRQW